MGMKNLEFFVEPSLWPKANYSPEALLRYTIPQMEKLLGIHFAYFVEEGENSAGIAIRTASGEKIGILQHFESESSPSIYLEIGLDRQSQAEEILNIVLNELGLQRDDVLYDQSAGYTWQQVRAGEHLKSFS